MIDFKRKKICTDEDTLKNLHNMKADRVRLGLTQVELSIRIGWDIHENPNYLFYEEYRHSYNRMQTQKRRYAYTNIELSREVNSSEESVRHVIKKKSVASVSNYARVIQVFREQERLAEFRRGHR